MLSFFGGKKRAKAARTSQYLSDMEEAEALYPTAEADSEYEREIILSWQAGYVAGLRAMRGKRDTEK